MSKEKNKTKSIVNDLDRKRDITMISIKSHTRRIKLSNLRSKVLITGNLKHDCSLVVSKD